MQWLVSAQCSSCVYMKLGWFKSLILTSHACRTFIDFSDIQSNMSLGEIDLYILHSMEVAAEYCSGRLGRYIGIYYSTLQGAVLR